VLPRLRLTELGGDPSSLQDRDWRVDAGDSPSLGGRYRPLLPLALRAVYNARRVELRQTRTSR